MQHELKPVSVESIRSRATGGSWVDILREFMASDTEAVEVLGIDNQNSKEVERARSGLRMGASRLDLPVIVKVRQWRLYLVKRGAA